MEDQQFCPICKKRAYPLESENINGALLHKRCFKCSACHIQLTLKSFLSAQGKLYCKVHYPKPVKPRTIITYEDGIYCEIRNDFEVNTPHNQNDAFQKIISSMFFDEDQVKCEVADVYNPLLNLLPQIAFRIPCDVEINVDCFNTIKKELSDILGPDEFAIIGLEKSPVIVKIALLNYIRDFHDKTSLLKEKAKSIALKSWRNFLSKALNPV